MLYELVPPLKLLCLHILYSLSNGLCWPVKLSATFCGAASYDMRFIYRSSEREKRGLPLFFRLCSLGPWERRPNEGRLPSVLDLIYQWEKIPGARKVKLQYS